MGICLAGLVLMCFASDKMIGYAPHAGLTGRAPATDKIYRPVTGVGW